MVAVSWCAGLDTDYHAAVWVTEPCLGPVLEDRPWLHVKKVLKAFIERQSKKTSFAARDHGAPATK